MALAVELMVWMVVCRLYGGLNGGSEDSLVS